MGRKVLLDGKITSEDCIDLKLDSPALNYGCGLFETVLYENEEIFFLNDHTERLISSCNALNIPEPDVNLIKNEIIKELIERNGLSNERVKIKILYAPLITIKSWNTVVLTSVYKRNTAPLDLSVYPVPRENPFYKHKSMSYMQNIICKDFFSGSESNHEVLFLDLLKNISEGSVSNLICVKDNILYYNGSTENILSGIMQKKIIHDHKIIGYSDSIPLDGIPFEFLKNCDSLFITNSLKIAADAKSLTYFDHKLIYSMHGEAEKIRDFYLR